MIRQTKPARVEPLPQWQTIYCSLMLLLVVFFVMLISYSAIDKDKFLQIKKITQTLPNILQSVPDMNQAMQSLKQLAINLDMNKDFAVIKTNDGFKAVFPNPVLFGSGDASLNEDVYPVLDGIIKIAKHNHLSIQVEGHYGQSANRNSEISFQLGIIYHAGCQYSEIFARDWQHPCKKIGGCRFFRIPADSKQ